MEWLVVVALLSAMQMVSGLLNSTSIIATQEGFNIYPCLQVNHRESDIDTSMMGLWHVIEIIQHQDESKLQHPRVLDSCPNITLYMTSTNFIRLIWHEKGGDVNYFFKLVDPENRGFWFTWSKQNGSMENKVYDQFSGSVQVLEALPSRMVLTFCSSQPVTSQSSSSYSNSHYSMIMVRNISIPHDTRDTRQTLSNYGLKEFAVRQTCKGDVGSNAFNLLPSLTMILLSVYLLLFQGN